MVHHHQKTTTMTDTVSDSDFDFLNQLDTQNWGTMTQKLSRSQIPGGDSSTIWSNNVAHTPRSTEHKNISTKGNYQILP